MPNVLVWGRTRDLIAGDLPAGLPVVEVSSLEEASSRADSRGCLLLADAAVIEAHVEPIQKWLGDGGSAGMLLVAVADADKGDDVLQRLPFVDDLLVKPVTAGRLRLRLDRAFDALHNRRVVRQLEAALDRKGNQLQDLEKIRVKLNEIGVALSAERDIEKLLEMILRKSMEITAADAGSLYLVERGKDFTTQTDDLLRFKLTRNDSVIVTFEEFTLPLSPSSIAGYVALTGEPLNLVDVYHLPPDVPYSGSGGAARSFDEKSGYRTKSMLAVPMKDHKKEVIGVVQLINKKKDPGVVLRPVAVVDEEVVHFTEEDAHLGTSLASQAAVAFENTLLIQNIKALFDSFVSASVATIEKRDPTTSGHSRRVATLTVALAERVDAATSGPFREMRFSRDQIQEIEYASLLHDFGKVGVKEKYLLKARKLYDSHLELVAQRFAYIQRTLQVQHLQRAIDRMKAGGSLEELAELDRAFQSGWEEVARLLQAVREANKPAVVEAEDVRAVLAALARRTYVNIAGREEPYLTADEVAALSLPRGSLTAQERDEINKHVEHTYEFLKELPWGTTEYRRVAEIAGAHHEKLDGSGYPRGLKAGEIPVQSLMMTISDIYDALTAQDRPYKGRVPTEEALDILKKQEAGRGKIDADLLSVFIEAKIYELTEQRAPAGVS